MNERKTDVVPKLLSNIRIMPDFTKSMNVSGRSVPMNEADKVCRRAIDGYSQAIGNTECEDLSAARNA